MVMYVWYIWVLIGKFHFLWTNAEIHALIPIVSMGGQNALKLIRNLFQKAA